MKKRKGVSLERTAEPPCNRKIKFGLTLLALFTLAHAFGQDMIIVINKTGCTMHQGTTFYSGANSFDVRYTGYGCGSLQFCSLFPDESIPAGQWTFRNATFLRGADIIYSQICNTGVMQNFTNHYNGGTFTFSTDGSCSVCPGQGLDNDTDDADLIDGEDGDCPGTGDEGCCHGSPVWRVSEPYTSLWIDDEPLEYQPSVGPRVSLRIAYDQRTYTGLNQNFFGIGPHWNLSWFSYVEPIYNSTNYTAYLPGGRRLTYYGTNDYITNTRLSIDGNHNFTIYYPDGSKDVYAFRVQDLYGTAWYWTFLSEHWNSNSQKITFYYADYDYSKVPNDMAIRLDHIVDADGRVTHIYYSTNNANTNLISSVVDPFSRTNLYTYTTAGELVAPLVHR